MNAVSPPQKDFSTHFSGREIFPNDDEDLLRAVQELRYQVYCEECGFLAPEDYPDGRESDEHDVNSNHFVALNQQNALVGYVRLVLPDAIQTFPFQNHCVTLLDGVTLPPAARSAEISRLMVRKDYRRRHGERPPSGAAIEEAESAHQHEMRSRSPQILLCMYREMYAYSLQNDIRYWYAAMERPLARMLTRMEFGFEQIGPATDYYGPVAPYVADLRVLEKQLSKNNPDLLSWMGSRALI